jgi:hypothetical protein
MLCAAFRRETQQQRVSIKARQIRTRTKRRTIYRYELLKTRDDKRRGEEKRREERREREEREG